MSSRANAPPPRLSQGQATDIEIHAKEILSIKKKLNDLLAAHTGTPVEQVAKDTERDKEIRKAFPKIHVRFVADEAGNTHALALPELDAYLHAGDIAPLA